MARRNKRDAAAVNQRPFHHARKDFSCLGFGQQISERGFGIVRGKFAGGGKKIFVRAFNLFRQPAPVEAVNGFGGDDFVQRFQRPRGLGAGAAVIIAAQAGGLFSRREAENCAGREGERDFFFVGENLWQRLAEQVKFESGKRKAESGTFTTTEFSFSMSVLTKTKTESLPSADSRSSA